MAGDWIKFRSEITTNPKFLTLANQLIWVDLEDGSSSAGLLAYTCGPENIGIGVSPPSNKTVTEQALRCVTVAALRDVTLCALLRVWSAVNAHCRVVGNDAIMEPMTKDALDDIAGFDGFGDAMSIAGWVEEQNYNSLKFNNFLEYNEPSCLRKTPMSNAERQRKYRQRHSDQNAKNQHRNETLRAVTKSNDREEKRREEYKISPPISPPTGGEQPAKKSPKRARRQTVPAALLELPWSDDEFRAAWDYWATNRRVPGVDQAVADYHRGKLLSWGRERSIAALRCSGVNRYQGIFEENKNGQTSKPAAADPTRQRSHKDDYRFAD